MKKILLIALLLLALIALPACDERENEQTPPANADTQMTAKIISIGEKLEVEVIESLYADGVYLVHTGEQTTYLDSEGNTLTRTDLSIGDTVLITYSGQVMMSIPPQIVALSITVQ